MFASKATRVQTKSLDNLVNGQHAQERVLPGSSGNQALLRFLAQQTPQQRLRPAGAGYDARAWNAVRAAAAQPGNPGVSAISGMAAPSIQRKCSACAEEDEKVQAKEMLSVNKPNDPLEHEADRFADQVMRGHSPDRPGAAAGAIQRDVLDDAVAKVEEEDAAKPVTAGAGAGTVATKRWGEAPAAVPSHAIPRDGGRPLDPGTRHWMSERSGYDFSAVRIHADSEAAASAAGLSARAFTVGSDIYFNQGQYQPDSREGRTLLAHELAHTVQQGATAGRPSQGNLGRAQRSIQRDLTPPGNCIQGIHDAMQREVKAWCDHPSGRACTPGEPCPRLLQKIRRNQMCARNRRIINDTCYAGGDAGHRTAEMDARRAQANCMQIFRETCEPRPEPVPVPETQPERRPVDQGFLDRMAAITGLTGTALIIYLIVSEGSRLFPPRNLVPVP